MDSFSYTGRGYRSSQNNDFPQKRGRGGFTLPYRGSGVAPEHLSAVPVSMAQHETSDTGPSHRFSLEFRANLETVASAGQTWHGRCIQTLRMALLTVAAVRVLIPSKLNSAGRLGIESFCRSATRGSYADLESSGSDGRSRLFATHRYGPFFFVVRWEMPFWHWSGGHVEALSGTIRGGIGALTKRSKSISHRSRALFTDGDLFLQQSFSQQHVSGSSIPCGWRVRDGLGQMSTDPLAVPPLSLTAFNGNQRWASFTEQKAARVLGDIELSSQRRVDETALSVWKSQWQDSAKRSGNCKSYLIRKLIGNEDRKRKR
ncbi:uncharacterized protein CLUP02_07262 [Colletotrichum lupini]|uniref:Uncharacterized protein n=1 Tax=Colletotrichum lupini TaxID=145971 RepID=A0A9Q8SS12_9PEZI|nr:uncharacterized protein CLUP02_07262 [Colletotrichum lupini]UQC81776.1 hypothetical protein CLUP02_07262 [Colletotrichum lupini]